MPLIIQIWKLEVRAKKSAAKVQKKVGEVEKVVGQ